MTLTPVSTSIELSLTLNLTGLVEVISSGLSDRGVPEATLDDIAIESILHDTYDFGPDLAEGRKVRTVDLLKNVDTSAPALIQFFENLLTAVAAEASEALLAEVDE